MLCAYVICHCFFRTLSAFISKITFIVTIFYVPTCSQNFYKFKGLLNAIKMTIILICNCITKRTHHIAGLKKSQSIYYSPPFLCCFNTFWMSPDYAWVFGFFIICKGHPHYLSFKDRLVASKAVWFIPCSYWWYCSPPFLMDFRFRSTRSSHSHRLSHKERMFQLRYRSWLRHTSLHNSK